MKFNEIMSPEESAEDILRTLIDKNNLSKHDEAKAIGLLARLKANRRNPKEGPTPDKKSGHINDPFGGMAGADSPEAVAGTDATGVTRY